MNPKQTKEDKIYVYSSFKQICLLACSSVSSAVTMYSYELFVYKCLLQKLFRSGNAGSWKLIINYTLI